MRNPTTGASVSERDLLAAELAAARESASAAIVGVDADGTIVSWGAGGEGMYGYAADEVEGKPLSLLAGEDGESSQAPDLLEPWQGGLLLLGYGLVAALLGTLLAVRRDVV